MINFPYRHFSYCQRGTQRFLRCPLAVNLMFKNAL